MWCRAGDEAGYHVLPDTDEEQGKGPPPSQGEAEAYREEVTPSFLPCLLIPLPPATPHTCKAALLAAHLNYTHSTAYRQTLLTLSVLLTIVRVAVRNFQRVVHSSSQIHYNVLVGGFRLLE